MKKTTTKKMSAPAKKMSAKRTVARKAVAKKATTKKTSSLPKAQYGKEIQRNKSTKDKGNLMERFNKANINKTLTLEDKLRFEKGVDSLRAKTMKSMKNYKN